MLMKSGTLSFLCLALLSAGFPLHAAETTAPPRHPICWRARRPLISPSASFGKNSTDQPTLPLDEFRALIARDTPTLTRAASKINENCMPPRRWSADVKNQKMQITWLPIQGPEQKAAKAKAQEYMSAVLRRLRPR
jgi:hypothetical protein